MIKRTIEVSTPGTYIKTSEDQLVFMRDKQEVGDAPLEDIGVLIIDERQVTCTQAALVAAVENGAVVILCGEDHHPAGYLLPVAGNQLFTERLQWQTKMKKPTAKRLWKQIVETKLRRQGDLIDKQHPAKARICQLGKNVQSGDTGNCEGQAARYYWPALLGDTFRRHRDGPPPNNLLNYGYMVLRAAVARSVCAAGLHPALGLHHHHRNNPFCLADDLMEPYRPYVDKRTKDLWQAGWREIDKNSKTRLLRVLTDPVVVAGKKGPLMVALNKTAASLVDCLSGKRQEIDLPQP